MVMNRSKTGTLAGPSRQGQVLLLTWKPLVKEQACPKTARSGGSILFYDSPMFVGIRRGVADL